VLLNPSRCTPSSWEHQRCRIPSTAPSAVSILREAGVKVGLSVPEDNFQRGLLWEAGWARVDDPKMNISESIGLVTWNIADMYNLPDGTGRILPNTPARFILYSGEPGKLSSMPKLIIDSTRNIVNPEQA
jgi:hypothetical protein